MTKAKAFRKNILSNASATAAGLAVQLLLVSILARSLNVVDFADYVTAMALVAIAELLSDFGTRIWATHSFALQEPEDKILRLSVRSKVFYTVAGFAILAFFGIKLLSPGGLILTMLIAVTQPGTDPLLWYLRGKEKLYVEAWIVFSWRVASAVVMGAFAFFGAGIVMLLSIWLACNLLRTVFSSRLAVMSKLRLGSFFRPEPLNELIEVVKTAFPVGAAFLMMSLYQRLSVLLLKAEGTPLDVAVFGAAFTLVASSGFISTSITVSAFPRLVQALEAGDTVSFNSIMKEKLHLITLIMGSICAIGILFSPLIISVFYGATYDASKAIMTIMMPGLYISCINFSLKYVLNSLGLSWLDFVSVCLGIFFLVIILFSKMDVPLAQKAALAWVGGELAVFFLKWVFLKRSGKYEAMVLARVLLVFFLLSAGAFAKLNYLPLGE